MCSAPDVSVVNSSVSVCVCVCVCSAPDVSVVSSSVSGHEGGDISVQCFYSSGYQNEVKQWCRYKDQSCYTVGRTDTSQNSSVQISDDGRRSFTVLMTGLRRTDSGWYFCSVGDLQVPVHLLVQRDNTNKSMCKSSYILKKHFFFTLDFTKAFIYIWSVYFFFIFKVYIYIYIYLYNHLLLFCLLNSAKNDDADLFP